MKKPSHTSASARHPLLGYRGQIILAAALAAGAPLAVLGLTGQLRLALGSGLLALIGLGLLSRVLRPLGQAAAELRQAVVDSEGDDPFAHIRNQAQRLLADTRHLTSRLETLRFRLTHRHPITGLPTREPFLTAVGDDAKSAVEPVVLGVIRFNDYDRLAAFDQAAADAALKVMAGRLQAAVPGARPVAQVDRDCFALWFGGADGVETAANELQAIAYVLAQEITEGELKITPDIGMGAAIHPDDGADPSVLLTRAFAALGAADRAPLGRLNFFSSESSEAARERFALEQALKQAISRDQLLLHFQPVVDVAAGHVVGAEALLRWRHPELGLVPPGRFIPVLEQTGMMDEVGLWVLNTACRQARAWEELGLPGLKMAVNLSARQFRDPALNTTILRTLERHRLPPHSLELELTETAAMEDARHTRQLLGDLRDLGVSVAIDDFGTGYSSLSYLKNLPFSKLKIDREFVTDVDRRRDSHAICTALVELARGLDITVLAEGVETREEAETLRQLGCSMFQGFFFARPLSAEDFAKTVIDPEFLALLMSPVHRELAGLSRRVRA